MALPTIENYGLQRRELDGFDGFDQIIPADISKSEYDALINIWAELGGRKWKMGEKWRFSDACEWEGVTVRGGEMAIAVPEEYVRRFKIRKNEPKKRRGDPRFSKNEKVLLCSRFGEDGLSTWKEGDPLRKAIIKLVAVRGKGVKQEVEYDIRFTDGVVTSLDLGYNGLCGVLPSNILMDLPFLKILRLNGNELRGNIDVQILKAKARGTLEVHLNDNEPGFTWPSNLHDIITPPNVPDPGPPYLQDQQIPKYNKGTNTLMMGKHPPGFPTNLTTKHIHMNNDSEENGSGSGGGGNNASIGYFYTNDLLKQEQEEEDEDDELLQPLKVLDLTRCSLIGCLGCESLAQLTSLTSLILDDNKFTGVLPADQLTHLKQLEILSIERNCLTGILPASMCMMHKSLRIIRLGNNMLAGPLPTEWSNLELLQELVLGGNDLIDSLRDGWIASALPGCVVTF